LVSGVVGAVTGLLGSLSNLLVGVVGLVSGLLRAVLALVLSLVATVVPVLAAVLCVTILLLPLGHPAWRVRAVAVREGGAAALPRFQPLRAARGARRGRAAPAREAGRQAPAPHAVAVRTPSGRTRRINRAL
jgi:hypothetical protein